MSECPASASGSWHTQVINSRRTPRGQHLTTRPESEWSACHVSRHGGKGIEAIMPYIIVRESYINNSCVVDGLPSNEVRLITEKVSPACNWY